MTTQMFSYAATAIFCFSLAWAQEPLTMTQGLSEDVMVSRRSVGPASRPVRMLIAQTARRVHSRPVRREIWNWSRHALRNR